MRDVRDAFMIDDTIVSALKGAELGGTSSTERRRAWVKQGGRPKYIAEYLLPKVVRSISRSWPSFTNAPSGHAELSSEALAARVAALGPWSVPWPLAHGLSTMPDNSLSRGSEDRLLYRRELINGTVASFLGDAISDTTVLDVGCNSGFFSMDLAERGAKRVDGVDLRPQNIAQAQFLAEHYGVPNVHFAVRDVDEYAPDQQWDVVLNLGVLYHVTDPLGLIRRTYELCREFAIIDTNCHREPVSAYLLVGDRDIDKPTEGSRQLEFHPTYRGVIDTIEAAGFSEVIEIVGFSPAPHDLYQIGTRRCFLAVK